MDDFYLVTNLKSLVSDATNFKYDKKKMTFKKWKRLHSLIYFIAPLAAIHYYLLKKADKTEPLIYLIIILFLLIWRIFEKILKN